MMTRTSSGLLHALVLAVLALACCADAYWDFMLFEQQWAPGLCRGNSTLKQGLGKHGHHHVSQTCKIPAQASPGFTIHGSWPNKLGSEGPNYCNNSWPFSADPIEDLVPEMDVYWPSLYGSNPAFWSHEWVKHGVCAATLSVLGSEYKYFSFVLNVRKKNDFKAFLSSAGIEPSVQRAYTADSISKAIQSSLGVKPVLSCVDDGTNQYLSQMAVCISRDLQIAECDSSVFKEASCTETDPVVYLPHHQS